MTKMIGAILTLGVLASGPGLAEKPKVDMDKGDAAAIVEAMKAAGLDDASVAAIKKALEGKDADPAPVIETKVFRKSVIIGPDGKARTLTDEEMKGIDLGKGLLNLKKLGKQPKDGDREPAIVSGKVTVVGPDGKVQTTDLDLGGDLESLNEVLKEAMGGINLDDLGVDPGVFSVGPGFLIQPDALRKDSTQKEIEKLRKELAEQRTLLEKILSKLE